MELKHSFRPPSALPAGLLIVPYGIETAEHLRELCGVHLLIVPYGIETCHGGFRCSRQGPFNRTLWN